MQVALMQPYLFPYIGYFQLINAVDTFVLHDDVQWIKGGWINRNQILLDGEPHLCTLPVVKKSSYDLINQCKVTDIPREKKKILGKIQSAYSNAPFFLEVMPIVKDVFSQSENNIAKYVLYSLKKIIQYLDVPTNLVMSSELQKDDHLKGQSRVIEICSQIGAVLYVNPPGGVGLYDKNKFKEAGIDLYFLKSNKIQYQQSSTEFVSNLSIIDVLMFNSTESVQEILKQFTLV
jgi:hypothetical protein